MKIGISEGNTDPSCSEQDSLFLVDGDAGQRRDLGSGGHNDVLGVDDPGATAGEGDLDLVGADNLAPPLDIFNLWDRHAEQCQAACR